MTTKQQTEPKVSAPKARSTPKNGLNYLDIPIGNIDFKPGFNPRTEVGDISDLKATIKANKLMNPITVCPAAEGSDRYLIIAGARRYMVCKELGYVTMPCTVRSDVSIDSPQALALALTENDRENLTDMDLASAYGRLYDLVKDEYKDERARFTAVGGMVGRSHQHVRITMRLLDAPEALQQKLNRGEISKQAVVTLAEVPEEIRQRVTDRVVTQGDKVTEGDVRRIANEVKRDGAATVDTGKVIDLEAETAHEDAPTPRSRNQPAGTASAMVQWRTKTEVREQITTLVHNITKAAKEKDESGVDMYQYALAGLLWVTGAIENVETGTKEFRVALKDLQRALPGEPAGDDE